jgi:hypothetical protein
MMNQYQPTHARLVWRDKPSPHPSHVQGIRRRREILQPARAYARERAKSMQTELKQGEPVYLLGIGPAGHNAGVILVEVSCE